VGKVTVTDPQGGLHRRAGGSTTVEVRMRAGAARSRERGDGGPVLMMRRRNGLAFPGE
jgi:hypothetical protein